MKIVLTGATGYIGGHIAKRLLQEGHEVYCVVRPSSDIEKLPKGAMPLVMETNSQLYADMAQVKPQVVIHLAGVFLRVHHQENIEQLLESNVVFATMLLDAAYESGCHCFINTGSYWQNYNREEYNPVNLYAATKQAFEDMIQYYVRAGKLTVMDLKLFDVFGPNDPRGKILNLVAGLQDGAVLKMSPGEQKMYMCYIDDVVDAYLHALKRIVQAPIGIYEKWAVRAEVPYTLKEILSQYVQMAGKNVTLQWGGLDYREREPMNPDGIGRVLEGWKPKYSLEEGLRMYCEEV